MDAQQIANLRDIMGLNIPHICLNYYDLEQLTNVPAFNKNFYRCYDRYARNVGKRGFLVGTSSEMGQKMIWSNFYLDHLTLKVAFSPPKDCFNDKVWSEPMSFAEAGDPMTIYKTVKMRSFW